VESEPEPAAPAPACSWAATAARDLTESQPLPPLATQPTPQPAPAPPYQPTHATPGPAAPAFQPAPPPPSVEAPAPVPQQPLAPAAQHGAVTADPGTGWMRFNGLALNHETRVVTVNGSSVDLTRTEFDLLASLMSTGRRVRSKADLVLTMRGQQYVTSYFVNEADKRSVEVHIANLRRKLGDDAATPRYVETVRGVGYRLAEGS
jgi:two-component system OmpR family response regulator